MDKAEEFLKEHGHIPICSKINPDYAPPSYDYVIERETLHELFRVFASEYARQEDTYWFDRFNDRYPDEVKKILDPHIFKPDSLNNRFCKICGKYLTDEIHQQTKDNE